MTHMKKYSITILLALVALTGWSQGNHILSLSGMPADMTVEKYRQQDAVQQMPWLKWFIDYDPSATSPIGLTV